MTQSIACGQFTHADKIAAETLADTQDNNALNRSGVYFPTIPSSVGRDLPLYPTTLLVKLTLFGPLG